MQDTKLHIVFVEDVPAEAARVEAALRKEGLEFSLQRVETREAFLHELASQPPDVILSDHGLPNFDGLAALDIAHRKFPNVPFIFVTSSLTREMEIEKLAPGVTDYVSKRQLSSLVPAIRRALQSTVKPRTSRMAPEKREELIAKLLALLAEYDVAGVFIPICACCKKIRDKKNEWHPPEIFFRKNLGLEFTHGMCPDCVETFYGSDTRTSPEEDLPG